MTTNLRISNESFDPSHAVRINTVIGGVHSSFVEIYPQQSALVYVYEGQSLEVVEFYAGQPIVAEEPAASVVDGTLDVPNLGVVSDQVAADTLQFDNAPIIDMTGVLAIEDLPVETQAEQPAELIEGVLAIDGLADVAVTSTAAAVVEAVAEADVVVAADVVADLTDAITNDQVALDAATNK